MIAKLVYMFWLITDIMILIMYLNTNGQHNLIALAYLYDFFFILWT